MEVSNNLQRCIRCDKKLEKSMFINKKGKPTKTCSICCQTISQSYHATKSTEIESSNDCNPIEPKEMEKQLFDQIFEIGSNEYVESESGIEFSCKILINSLNGTSQEIGKKIAEMIGYANGYYYIYRKANQSKNSHTIWYYCSQNCALAKRPQKHENQDKQRDKEYIERYDCNGTLKISLNIETQIATVNLQHDLLHKRPDRFGVNDTIKEEIKKNLHLTPSDIFKQLEQQYPNLTQKQVHAWWSYFIKETYVRDNNQLLSAQMLLHEYKYELLYKSSEVGIQYFGFITPFFDILKSNKEIIVDATYKTNALGFELYAIMGQFDGAGFSMAYLFVDNSKKNNGARTEILKGFFQSLYDRGLNNIQFFLTDKDFSQITASQNVWSSAKIQLCLWHIKKALKKRLSDNTLPKTTTYSSSSANENFSFIDIEFYPSNLQVKKSNFVFCPKDLRQNIISLFEKHLHLHPLIPNINGNFLTSTEIWKASVEEMYNFCFTNDLRHVWAYLWSNWYEKKMWILWARSSVATKICIFRTTMLMESHWKVVKRDYLPKFFRPRLDLVTYIIISRLIPHHQQQFNKYQQGREIVSWRKEFKKEWVSLSKKNINGFYLTNIETWTCSCPSFLLSRFFICKHLVHQSQFRIDSQFFRRVQRQGYYPFLTFNTNSSESTYDISKEDNILKDITYNNTKDNIIRDITNHDAENGPILFKEIKLLLNDLREIVDEQESLENYQWIQAVNNGFNGVRKIVNDVKTYRKRITNPRTWKDHNINTMFLES